MDNIQVNTFYKYLLGKQMLIALYIAKKTYYATIKQLEIECRKISLEIKGFFFFLKCWSLIVEAINLGIE